MENYNRPYTDYLIKNSRLDFGRNKITIRDYENNHFNCPSLNLSDIVMLTHHYRTTRSNKSRYTLLSETHIVTMGSPHFNNEKPILNNGKPTLDNGKRTYYNRSPC